MSEPFLILSLFVPRLTILTYYCLGIIPHNAVPFLGDILLSVFLPRVLILIYIAGNIGYDNVWFWLHLSFAILAYGIANSGESKEQ